MVTRCPAFHDICMSSVECLKLIVVEQSGGSVWCSTFESWDTILKVLICPDCVTPLVPGLSDSLNNIEKVSVTGSRYIIHFYCFAVEAGFYSNVVECLCVDPATWVRFPAGAGKMFSLYDNGAHRK